MKPFVFIFRQSKHPMTQEQQKRRTEEVRAWAIQLRDAGHALEPHMLGEERFFEAAAGSDGSGATAGGGDPVTAILIAGFQRFEEATKAAQTHPGLRYGVSVEVREAFPPVPAPVQ